MRIGLSINYAGEFAQAAREVADLERAGVDVVFVPEAYSFDAVSALGFWRRRRRGWSWRRESCRSTPAPRR